MKLVLSKREVAEMLGIDRSRTLGRLIETGLMRTVPWGDGVRIPREDVERVARQGIPKDLGKPARMRRRDGRYAVRPPDSGVGDRIRALPHGRREG